MGLFRRKREAISDVSDWVEIKDKFQFEGAFISISESDTFLYLHCILLDPMYRGKGYGLTIIQEMMRYAKENEKAFVVDALDVDTVSFDSLVRFYVKAGFTKGIIQEIHCPHNFYYLPPGCLYEEPAFTVKGFLQRFRDHRQYGIPL